MSIQINYGAGNSLTRDINGFESVIDALRDERTRVALGLPQDLSILRASIDGEDVDPTDDLEDGDVVDLFTKSPSSKG